LFTWSTLFWARPPSSHASLSNQSLSLTEHVSNYIDYFQSKACSGRNYALNEQVILILGRLLPNWWDLMKLKYTQLVPQSGPASNVPLECRLEMLIITLAQLCFEKRLESPSVKIVTPTPERVFAIQDTPLLLDPLLMVDDQSFLQLGTMPIPMASVDGTIEYIVCFVDRKARGESYPKCEACGLPGYSLKQCHPLVNFCLVLALYIQQLDLVRNIKADYKHFSRSARGRPSRPSTVKLLVVEVALVPQDPDEFLASDSLAPDSIAHLPPPDNVAPNM
jgi:hypothetical protein